MHVGPTCRAFPSWQRIVLGRTAEKTVLISRGILEASVSSHEDDDGERG